MNQTPSPLRDKLAKLMTRMYDLDDDGTWLVSDSTLVEWSNALMRAEQMDSEDTIYQYRWLSDEMRSYGVCLL